MSDAHRRAQLILIGVFVLLVIPGVNWIVGTLLAASAGWRLLYRGEWLKLLCLAAGATLWALLSFYLIMFGASVIVAVGMMLGFVVWTWVLLKLIVHWDQPEESAQASLAGRIES